MHGGAGIIRERTVAEPYHKEIRRPFYTKDVCIQFFCDKCEKEWRSTPQAFDFGGLRSSTDLRIFRMLWNDQYKAAYERANLEAIYALSFCPECGRRVCMECFCRSEVDVVNICKDCLSKK